MVGLLYLTINMLRYHIQHLIHCNACEFHYIFIEPRFWQRVSERYHNISKSCETKARCDAEAAEKGFKCMRDWYRDWDCVECCQGDRCNYYATVSLISSSQLDEITRLYFAKKRMSDFMEIILLSVSFSKSVRQQQNFT